MQPYERWYWYRVKRRVSSQHGSFLSLAEFHSIQRGLVHSTLLMLRDQARCVLLVEWAQPEGKQNAAWVFWTLVSQYNVMLLAYHRRKWWKLQQFWNAQVFKLQNKLGCFSSLFFEQHLSPKGWGGGRLGMRLALGSLEGDLHSYRPSFL